MDNLLFYDIEVFKYDALVVFKNIDNKVIGKFWSIYGNDDIDVNGFEGVPELIKDKVLVGYNNYHYDDTILSEMIDGHNGSLKGYRHLYYKNLRLISGENISQLSDKIKSFDTMQQIEGIMPSLKQIEGNMGRSIIESEISFDIDRPLTDDEKRIVEKYCEYDIETTINVYKLRKKSYFDVKASLIEMLPEDMRERAVRYNTTTLSAMILTKDHKIEDWKTHHVPDNLWRNVEGIPSEIWDMWEEITRNVKDVIGKGKSKTIKAFGCSVVFGLGGLHGAPTKPCIYEGIDLDDVGSMYPSAIKMLGALGDATDLYDGMRKRRLEVKHTDKTLADALKLILNSVYGNFKNKYSALYNPMASATVCIFGQIAIFTLAKMLDDAGFKVININTDGVAFVSDPKRKEEHEEIKAVWQKLFDGFVLETDHFDRWIQKDVNNYIATQGDHIKVKGGDVNKYEQDKFFSNNNCRIIQIALVEFLVNKKPIYQTLIDNRDKPILWQYVLKAGGTYKGTVNKDKILQQRVNRVFAASDEWTRKHPETVTTLYKMRQDDGLVNYPDAPDRMFLWNGEVNDMDMFNDMIDLEHYANIVKKKLEGWNVY